MRVDVPFRFHVGDQVMAPGQYQISRVSIMNSQLWKIALRDGTAGAFFTPRAPIGAVESREGKLVFTTYGNQHFLSQVYVRGQMAWELHQTPAEIALAKATQAVPTRVGEAAREQ